ncbi:hypothetical protein DFH28DRAFT_1121813 [Melampsora americana]|nr:hypothetical protein DFH28DRAFT_1121813 [Melampsora americana]
MYTNYQTYSVTATTTQMPGKAVSQGFAERNTTVGTTWSTFNQDEQVVFTPRLFEPLCIVTSEVYALTQKPIGLAPIPKGKPKKPTSTVHSGLNDLSKEELDKYIPIFEQLVNQRKVSLDIHKGRLWRHSASHPQESFQPPFPPIVSQLDSRIPHFSSPFPGRTLVLPAVDFDATKKPSP